MSPERTGGYGSCSESEGGEKRPRSMAWFPTHRIVYSHPPRGIDTIEVMAWDRGVEAPGPGRYALYTEENAETPSGPEWTMDGEGRVWFQGEPLRDHATAVVEEISD